MGFRKQRRLMFEPCESREMLAADGLAVADPASMGKPAEVASVALDANEIVDAIPGDFDADGTVDGDDFLVWQVGIGNGTMDGDDYLAWQAGYGDGQANANGQVADAIPGDFDADGIVDGDDFLVWQVGIGNGTMDGDDYLAWQAGYGMNREVDHDPLEKSEITKAMATDVVMEDWARGKLTRFASRG